MSADLVRRLYLDSHVLALAALTVFLFLLSYALKHWIYARQFRRTDVLGIQRFPSYWKMQLVLFVERSAIRASKLVFGVALFFTLITAARLLT